jgi:hypothetical protein
MFVMTAIGASNSAISRESVRICEIPYVCGAAGQRRQPNADREAADRKT